jgi:hypothetical protein
VLELQDADVAVWVTVFEVSGEGVERSADAEEGPVGDGRARYRDPGITQHERRDDEVVRALPRSWNQPRSTEATA